MIMGYGSLIIEHESCRGLKDVLISRGGAGVIPRVIEDEVQNGLYISKCQ